MISDKNIKRLQKAVKEDYDKDITPAEASEIGNGLVGYFDLLAKIYYRMKVNNTNKNKQK